MTADLKKLSDSLRSDTPEKSLEREILGRRDELVAGLRAGKSFEIRDLGGRIVRISPSAFRNGKI
jgi:hypothetical protein